MPSENLRIVIYTLKQVSRYPIEQEKGTYRVTKRVRRESNVLYFFGLPFLELRYFNWLCDEPELSAKNLTLKMMDNTGFDPLIDDELSKTQKTERTWSPCKVFTIFFFPALGGLLFGYDIGATSYVSLQLQDKVGVLLLYMFYISNKNTNLCKL